MPIGCSRKAFVQYRIRRGLQGDGGKIPCQLVNNWFVPEEVMVAYQTTKEV